MPTKLLRLGLIDRYLSKSIAVPLIGSLVLAAMLLVLDKMLRLFQYVVDAGGPVSVVWRMLANLLPEYLSLGIPIGLMLGILLAFRKLAFSSELDALRGIGVGYGRLLRVPFAFAVPLALINLFIVGYLEPYTHYRYEGLRFDLKSGALGAAIKVGEFNKLGRHLTLRIDRSENKGTQLHGTFVQNEDSKGMTVAATAEHGRFLSTDDPDTILFRLDKGRLIQDSPRFQTPRTLAFESYDLPISLPVIDQFRRRAAGDTDELYLHELWRLGYGGGATTEKQKLEAQAHLNFRLVEVVMMFMLPFLAIALAVPPKRSSSALGIFVGILVVVAYHKVNQYAEQAGASGQLNPTLALWIPLILLSALIAWMYHVLAHKPGGQPIGALEWFFAKTAKGVRALMPRFGEFAGRMINLSFFPSRHLALYMVRLFLTRSLAVLIALVLVLMTLDLLGESGKILAVPGNGDAELWRYVGLRIPLLISRFLPFSVLLGTLIAFVGLNQHSEVVAMKAAGMSAHQILAPLVVASIGIAALLFAFNEGVVVNSAQVVDAWTDNDYKPIPPQSGILGNVWVLNGDDLIRAGVVSGRPPHLTAQRVTVYDRGGGALQRIIQAERAVPRPGSGDWLLEKVRIYDANMNVIRPVPQMTGMAGVTPAQLTLAKVDPNELDYWTLKQRIAELEAAGRPVDEARAGLAHKISGPLSTLLMPLLAAVAAFGLARSGQVLMRAVVGMALGFAYFVADNFSLAMGNAGAYPPIVAAWAPFLLFLLIGETVLIRTEE